MARTRRSATESVVDKIDPRFEGSAYSNQECLFLLDHLGEPAIVAIPEDEDLPDGVNEVQVAPLLQRTFELETYQNVQRERLGDAALEIWCGFDKLRDILQQTMDWREEVQELKRRTKGASAELRRAASAPSLHMWDIDTDQPYIGGEGADADRVLTRLVAGGDRVALYTDLRSVGDGSITSLAGIAKFVRAKTQTEQQSRVQQNTPSALIFESTGDTTSIIKCPICGYAEQYLTQRPSTKKAALAKVMAHLGSTKTRKPNHDLLLKRLHSGRAGSGARASRRRAQAEPLETVEV